MWFLFFFFLTMSNKCLILRISVRKLASYKIWNLQCIITNYRIWNSISNWWRLCVLEDFNLNLLFKVKYILERPNEAGNFTKNFYQAIENLLNFVQPIWYTVQVQQHVTPLLLSTVFYQIQRNISHNQV